MSLQPIDEIWTKCLDCDGPKEVVEVSLNMGCTLKRLYCPKCEKKPNIKAIGKNIVRAREERRNRLFALPSRVKKTCRECGKEFARRPNQGAENYRRQRFCSNKCYVKGKKVSEGFMPPM